jgi:hypothetical protein
MHRIQLLNVTNVVNFTLWFEAPGYQVQRDILLTAGGTEHEIILNR